MAAVPRDVVVNVHAQVDADALATALDQMREVLRAMVAALVADGFTPEQAHAITAATITRPAQ